MSSQPASPVVQSPVAPARSNPARFFYTAAGVLMLVCVLAGFRDFFFRGGAYPNRPITPPIRAAVIAHGVSMSLWIVLIIVQPLLIATRRHRVHFALGKVGAVLAGVILVVGLYTGTWSARVAPADFSLWGLNAVRFTMISYSAMIFFTILVAIGVWKRNRSEIHRPMMLLATLAALPAALDRIDIVRGLYENTLLGAIWGPYVGSLAIGVILLAVKCALTRSFDRWFALGLAGLALAALAAYQIAFTSAWESFAGAIVH